jgi:DNA-binding transcriptional LysR family regulator
MDLNSASFFVSVVKAGSFSAASRALSVPVSTMSDRVAALEKTLGAALLLRTTRKLKLTDAGAAFFQKAEAAVALFQAARDEVSGLSQRPTGTLRITGPIEFASAELAEVIQEYRTRCPEVEVEIHQTNRFVDLITEGYDIAIRGGHLPDSSLVARRLGAGCSILVASAGYLSSAPALRHPRDLLHHGCLGFVGQERERGDGHWSLRTKEGGKSRVKPAFAAASTSFSVLLELVRAGAGVALLPQYLVQDDLRRGRMTQVLPGWATASAPMHLVYPAQRITTPKVSVMIPLLERRLRALLGAGGASP